MLYSSHACALLCRVGFSAAGSGGKDEVSLTVIATWLHSGRVRDKARERRESEEREKVERKAKAEKRRNERAEAEAEALAQAKAKLKPKKAPKQSALVKALVSPRHLPTKPALMQERGSRSTRVAAH